MTSSSDIKPQRATGETRQDGWKTAQEALGEAIGGLGIPSQPPSPSEGFKTDLNAPPRIDYSDPDYQRELQKTWRLDEAGLPRRLQGKNGRGFIADTEGRRQIRALVAKWVKDFPGLDGLAEPNGLMLYGAPGSGKSHLAVAALIALVESGHRGLYVAYPDLISDIKATYGRKGDEDEGDVLGRYASVEILLLDDLGTGHSGKDWEAEKIYQLFNSRYNGGRATIITTNQAYPSPLDQWVDMRVISRMSEMCRIYGMTEPSGSDIADYRATFRRGFKGMSNRLNIIIRSRLVVWVEENKELILRHGVGSEITAREASKALETEINPNHIAYVCEHLGIRREPKPKQNQCCQQPASNALASIQHLQRMLAFTIDRVNALHERLGESRDADLDNVAKLLRLKAEGKGQVS